MGYTEKENRWVTTRESGQHRGQTSGSQKERVTQTVSDMGERVDHR